MEKNVKIFIGVSFIAAIGFAIWYWRRGVREVVKTVAGTAGLTRGLRNNNPGNIVKTDIEWIGEIEGIDSKFETFDTLDHGIRALLKLLKGYMDKGIDTPSKIINKYAPSTENDTEAYISQVVKYLSEVTKSNVGPNTVLTASLRPYLAFIIMKVENGVWVSGIAKIKAINLLV
jgi:hypothetical protein